jgi:hypothetical protein
MSFWDVPEANQKMNDWARSKVLHPQVTLNGRDPEAGAKINAALRGVPYEASGQPDPPMKQAAPASSPSLTPEVQEVIDTIADMGAIDSSTAYKVYRYVRGDLKQDDQGNTVGLRQAVAEARQEQPQWFQERPVTRNGSADGGAGAGRAPASPTDMNATIRDIAWGQRTGRGY